MTNKEHIKNKLAHQSILILDLLATIEYLSNYSDFLKKIDNQKGVPDLGFIYRILKDYLIINLNKLFHSKEKYSFNYLSSLIIEKYSKNSKLAEFKVLLKSANKIFNDLDILYIRNKHVGHLEPKRKERSLEWKKVKSLIDFSCEIHDSANLMVFRTQTGWNFDKEILNNLYSNHLVYINLHSKWRQMYHENKNSISLEEIEELIKTNWP